MSLEERRTRRSRSKYLRLILSLFILIPILLFFVKFVFFNSPTSPRIISAVEMINTSVTPTRPPEEKLTTSSLSLGAAVQSALVGTHGDYAVIVRNFKTGETYAQNEHEEFKSGSLYKLWIMGKVYEEIRNGDLKEDQVLSESVETLNKRFSIDPEYAERTEGTVTYSIKDALTQMITISDNYAALLLTLKIRLSSVTGYLADKGLSESKVGTNGKAPVTTASDVFSIFERIYKGNFAEPEYNKKMLDLLKAQRLNDKIPKFLPDNIVIAHKTGELDEVTHDAGIVYSPGGDYIIVVLSQSDAPQAAAVRVANVSEAVYNYFNPTNN